ncbi:MAG: ribosome silencing factor [Acidobacteriia bacterium]|nr:ribosome silencing factor [Terriglobia bacterium]
MSQETRQEVARAVSAVESKKGEDVVILEMDRNSGAFTDYFVLCSGANPRQIQSIADEVQKELSQAGDRPTSIEGYNQAEWVLLDYVNFVVHIFSERARKFYDLERLWKSAKKLRPADLLKKREPEKPAAKIKKPAGKKTAAKRPAKKTAKKRPASRPRPASRAKAKAKPAKRKR